MRLTIERQGGDHVIEDSLARLRCYSSDDCYSITCCRDLAMIEYYYGA